MPAPGADRAPPASGRASCTGMSWPVKSGGRWRVFATVFGGVVPLEPHSVTCLPLIDRLNGPVSVCAPISGCCAVLPASRGSIQAGKPRRHVAPAAALAADTRGRGRNRAPDTDGQKPPHQPEQPGDLSQADVRRRRRCHRGHRPRPPALIYTPTAFRSLPPTVCPALAEWRERLSRSTLPGHRRHRHHCYDRARDQRNDPPPRGQGLHRAVRLLVFDRRSRTCRPSIGCKTTSWSVRASSPRRGAGEPHPQHRRVPPRTDAGRSGGGRFADRRHATSIFRLPRPPADPTAGRRLFPGMGGVPTGWSLRPRLIPATGGFVEQRVAGLLEAARKSR